MFSVVIPVYRNEGSIPRLLQSLAELHAQMPQALEVVFVVDGSPDRSFELLKAALPAMPFPSQLIAHSRNFGSFPAIRTGLMAARGDAFGVMAADLQEPTTLQLEFCRILSADEADVVIGTRTRRDDPLLPRLASKIFWGLYRRLVVKDMPRGGVDVFGCNRAFRDELVKLAESRSSLVALIFWLGFRRQQVQYERLKRLEGKSAWSFARKFDYMMDSIFAFTDSPIRLLMRLGFVGCTFSLILGAAVLAGHLSGRITVPGYAATMLVVLFFGTLNVLGLGLVGTYAWRSYENSKQRPLAVVALRLDNPGSGDARRANP